MFRRLLLMTGLQTCNSDCSGRGECHNGTCHCEIRYSGDYCDFPNLPYHAAVGGLFLLVALVCAVQLVMCVAFEYRRLKAPTLLKACKVTTQKLLYFVTFLASAIRGGYFLSPENFKFGWSRSLLSAYYPLLMSGSSLLVCFWAETKCVWRAGTMPPNHERYYGFTRFALELNKLSPESHLLPPTDTRLRPDQRALEDGDLSGAETLKMQLEAAQRDRRKKREELKERYEPLWFSHKKDDKEDIWEYNGKYWEVFHLRDICWERPQFLSKSFFGFISFNIISYSFLLAEVVITQIASSPSDDIDFYTHLFNGCYAVLLFIVVIFFLIYGVEVYFKVRGGFVAKPVQIGGGAASPEAEPLRPNELRPRINNSQLHQSRVGLLSHALMLIVIVGFLFSETLSEFWKTKVPVHSRNWHDVLFRVVEIGVAIWFPAVLWNCMQPSELWILNPKKLLAKLDQKASGYLPTQEVCKLEAADDFEKTEECWICYDDKPEPFIKPCACTGDLSSVHHECLRRWLMESPSGSTEKLHCKVCKQPYDVHCTTRLDWEKGFTAQHWGSTAVTVTVLCVTVAGAWIVIQLFENSYIRIISASIALLIIYVCIKFLGQNTVSAYQRAKMGGLNISGRVTTISANVTIGVDPPTSSTEPHTAI